MKAVLNMAYDKLIVPMEDAKLFMDALSRAEKLEQQYTDEGMMYYVGGTPHLPSIEFISDEDYAVGKAAGPKPKG